MNISISLFLVLAQLFHFSNANCQILIQESADYSLNKLILFPSRYHLAFKDSLSLVSRDSKFGIIDSTGREVVPLVYDKIDINFNNRKALYAHVRYANEYFYDYWGNGYESEEEYAQLLEIEKNDSISYLNLAEKFNSNPLFVVKKGDQWGVINKRNELIIPIQYDYIQEMGQDIFLAKKEGKSGIINSENNILVTLTCDTIMIFQMISESELKEPDSYAILKMDNKYGAINLFTQRVVLPKYDSLERCYLYQEDHCLCAFSFNRNSSIYDNPFLMYGFGFGNVLKYQIGDKLGLLSISQMCELTAPIYDSIKFQSRGNYGYNNIVSIDGKYTFFKDENTNLHPHFYDEIKIILASSAYLKRIRDHYLFYRVKLNGHYEVLNEQGEKFLNSKWDDVMECIEINNKPTFEFIVKRKGKCGVVNNQNQLIVPIKYDTISIHTNGDGYHYLAQRNGKSKKIFIE